jgi:uncharacterized protein (DUF736 family)
MPAIGFVIKQSDGTFRGELRTLTITAPLEIKDAKGLAADAQYSVWIRDVHVGAGWNLMGNNNQPYIKLQIASPEFGARPLRANLGLDATDPDKMRLAIIWNPE